MEKMLYLIRGLPGSGKSTLARLLTDDNWDEDEKVWLEADTYHIDTDGVYRFNPERVKETHQECQSDCELAMRDGVSLIVVSNTFTRRWEMEPYYDLAAEYNYSVREITIHDRDAFPTDLAAQCIHNVPVPVIEKMLHRWER